MNVLLRRSLRFLLLVCGFATITLDAAPAVDLRPFTAKSFAAIKRAHAGQAFIIAFWSVTCEPCREEMMIVADLHREFPKVPLILVAADPPATRPAVIRFLGNYKLGRIETWQFDDDSAERLRYSVEKTWAGELPRSYFFNTAHEMTARSGVVDAKWLKAWLQTETAAARRSPGS
jgi:thiol-disulfide isomerase/thioredoxin